MLGMEAHTKASSFHTFLCCQLCFTGGTKIKTNVWKLDVFECGYMPQILAFSFSLGTLKFLIHNFFKTRVLLKIFDAEFPYKLFFLATLPTRQDSGENREKAYFMQNFAIFENLT